MAKCIICGKQEPVMRCICSSCLPDQPKALRAHDPEKVIPKGPLDRLIEATKTYNGSSELGEGALRKILNDISWARNEIEAVTRCSTAWGVSGFVDGLCGCFGMMPDATNEEIYMLLKMIGWEVRD